MAPKSGIIINNNVTLLQAQVDNYNENDVQEYMKEIFDKNDFVNILCNMYDDEGKTDASLLNAMIHLSDANTTVVDFILQLVDSNSIAKECPGLFSDDIIRCNTIECRNDNKKKIMLMIAILKANHINFKVYNIIKH